MNPDEKVIPLLCTNTMLMSVVCTCIYWHSCTGSFKLLCLLPEDCVFWNFQNVHNGEETETINETEELAPPTQLGNVKSSKSTWQCQVFETRRIECFDLR
jgi:hypothetical protein